MPSKTVSLAILDTSVYIDNFRTGRFTQKILASPFLFRGSSVVIHELLRGSRTAIEQAFVRDLAASLRLITPTAKDWQPCATPLDIHFQVLHKKFKHEVLHVYLDIALPLSVLS